MAKKIEMISQESFFGHIFRSVRSIFVFFNTGMYKEVYEELSDLQEFVELNCNEVCDWGYPCLYVVSHHFPLIPAADKDVLWEAIETFRSLLQGDKNDERLKSLASQYLWRLIEGWGDMLVIELFWNRMGLEPTIGYKRADIDGRVEKEKKISNVVK